MVIPELFRKPSLVSAVMRRSTFLLKLRLLREPGVVVTDVSQCQRPRPWFRAGAGRVRRTGLGPQRGVRACARLREGLGLERTRAVFFSFEEGDSLDIEAGWGRLGRISPRRDRPRLPRSRRAFPRLPPRDHRRPGTVVVVVMPELVVRGMDRLLHNQRALYLKRLLLFEPRVILTSVPYQLL